MLQLGNQSIAVVIKVTGKYTLKIVSFLFQSFSSNFPNVFWAISSITYFQQEQARQLCFLLLLEKSKTDPPNHNGRIKIKSTRKHPQNRNMHTKSSRWWLMGKKY